MDKNYKKQFESFLKENKYLPLTLWNSFNLKHGKADKSYEKTIKGMVGNKSGLYIYKKADRVLYAGKGSSLFGRIKSHFHESYEEVPNGAKGEAWYRFFADKNNIGSVKILWQEVRGEKARRIIEKMLDFVLNPEFENFRQKLKKE
jgi:hypothetical protein